MSAAAIGADMKNETLAAKESEGLFGKSGTGTGTVGGVRLVSSSQYQPDFAHLRGTDKHPNQHVVG